MQGPNNQAIYKQEVPLQVPPPVQVDLQAIGKEVAKLDREAYLFDISKADQIFDYLMKNKQIKLLKGHNILLTNEIKGTKCCKWNHF